MALSTAWSVIRRTWAPVSIRNPEKAASFEPKIQSTRIGLGGLQVPPLLLPPLAASRSVPPVILQ